MRVKNILIVHNGALGDFLCAWPGILAIYRHFGKMLGEDAACWFCGRDFGPAWLTELGISKAPPQVISDVESMYLHSTPPAWLDDTLVFWFCLKTPVAKTTHPNLISIPVLDFAGLPEPLPRRERRQPLVIENIRIRLEQCEITWEPCWQQIWQERFGAWQGSGSLQVGLLPGTGHTAKSWPLEKFEILSKGLDEAGFDPVYLLGPVERERGLLPLQARAEYPTPPPELAARMMQMRAVIACDGGPAHLASHHGVPGLVLFGPINWRTWAPAGLEPLLPPPCPEDKLTGYPAPLDDPKDIAQATGLQHIIDLIEPQTVLERFFEMFGKYGGGG